MKTRLAALGRRPRNWSGCQPCVGQGDFLMPAGQSSDLSQSAWDEGWEQEKQVGEKHV